MRLPGFTPQISLQGINQRLEGTGHPHSDIGNFIFQPKFSFQNTKHIVCPDKNLT